MFKEWKKLLTNKFAIIVMIGVILIPSMYAVAFLQSMWDPYSKVDNLAIAVVNKDKPVVYNDEVKDVGRTMIEKLQESDELDFHFVSEKEAMSGIEKGKYYMVIRIPEEFSESAISVLDDNPEKMEITYYTNPGYNFTVSKLVESAYIRIERLVSKAVTKAYAEAIFDKFGVIQDSLYEAADGSSQIYDGSNKLADGNDQITDGLGTLSSNLIDFVSGMDTLKDGTETLNASVPELTDGVNKLADGSNKLTDGSNELKSGISTYTEGVETAHNGSSSLRDGLILLKSKNKDLNEGASSLSSGLSLLSSKKEDLNTGTDTLKNGVNTLVSKNNELNTGAKTLADGFEQYTGGIDEIYAGSQNLNTGIIQISEGVNSISSQVSASVDNLNTTASETALTNLDDGVAQIQDGLNSLNTNYPTLIGAVNTYLGLYESETDKTSEAAQGYLNTAKGYLNQLSTLSTSINELSEGMDNLKPGVQQLTAGMRTVKTNTNALLTGLLALKAGIGNNTEEGTILYGSNALMLGLGQLSTGTGRTQLEAGVKSLENGITAYTNGVENVGEGLASLQQGIKTYTDGVETASSGAETLASGIKTYTDGVETASSGAETLTEGLGTLTDNNSALNEGAESLYEGSSALKDGLNTMNGKMPDLVNGIATLNDGAGTLRDGAYAIDSGVDKLHDGSKQLGDGIETLKNGAGELTDALQEGANKIADTNKGENQADMISNPVESTENKVSDMADNGSSMACYMMAISMWIGCTAFYMAFSFKINKREKNSTFKYFFQKGTVIYPASIIWSILMVGLLILIDGFTVANLEGAILTAVVSGICYMSIAFFLMLIFDFERIGNFMMLVFMVINITVACGVFPAELAAPFVGALTDYFPFTYTVKAFRISVAGREGLIQELIPLLVMTVITMSVTLLYLSYKFKKIRNEQTEEKMRVIRKKELDKMKEENIEAEWSRTLKI